MSSPSLGSVQAIRSLVLDLRLRARAGSCDVALFHDRFQPIHRLVRQYEELARAQHRHPNAETGRGVCSNECRRRHCPAGASDTVAAYPVSVAVGVTVQGATPAPGGGSTRKRTDEGGGVPPRVS